MYDAISNGLSCIAMGHHPRRVLVVVGDGGDNASTTTFDQVLKQAQASNAAIYTVGIIDPLERDANPKAAEAISAGDRRRIVFSERYERRRRGVSKTRGCHSPQLHAWLCLVESSPRRSVSSNPHCRHRP